MNPKVFHLHALSPVHCGVGQAVGVVDLPIARARASQLPIVPGSSLRGVLRQLVEDTACVADVMTHFGSPQGTGALAVNDAHLLALPVRCLAGVVSYVTSPFILTRYRQDLERAGCGDSVPQVPRPKDGKCLCADDNVNQNNGFVVLEDLDLRVESTCIDDWAARIADAVKGSKSSTDSEIKSRVVVVPDEVMSFLAETATEIRARISVDPATSVVKGGALWYEESLPAETILWGVMGFADPQNKATPACLARSFSELAPTESILQIGGNAGIGSGLIRFLHTW